MLTIREEIKKKEQRSDKTHNVELRFTLNRKIKRNFYESVRNSKRLD